MRTPVWLNSLLSTWQQWARLVPANNPLGLSAATSSVASNPLVPRASRHRTAAPPINKGGQPFLPPSPPATPHINTVASYNPYNNPASKRKSAVPTQSSTAFNKANYTKNYATNTKQRHVLNAPPLPISPIKSPPMPLISPNISKKRPTNDLVQHTTNTNRTRMPAINSVKTFNPSRYPVFGGGKNSTGANSLTRELAPVPMPVPPVLGSSWTNNQPLVQTPRMELALGVKKAPQAAFAPAYAQTPPVGQWTEATPSSYAEESHQVLLRALDDVLIDSPLHSYTT